ncbi:MAG: hypothetical protein ACRCZF_17715, partial [Gemmataceae bacterium]
NNLSLAAIDPVTGKVEIPSFHRAWLFNGVSGSKNVADAGQRLAPPLFNTDGTVASGDATNDWVTPAGRLRMVRPRPVDHVLASENPGKSQFPYVPRNPDGTYTGDVQNIKWTDGVQANDSFWMNIGAAPINWRNKLIVPLIAPIVLDLNARVNMNVAGMHATTGTPAQTNFQSSMGIWPAEVNIARLLEGHSISTAEEQTRKQEFAASINSRRSGSLTDRYTNQNTVSFNNNLVPPHYSQVDLRGVVIDSMGATQVTTAIQYPSTQNYPPFPTYPTGYSSGSAPNTFLNRRTDHFGLYNPHQWARTVGLTPATGAHAFGFEDLRLVGTRFSWATDRKPNTEWTGLMPNLVGSSGPNGTSQTDPNRVNSAAAYARMSLTPYSQTVHRPTVTVATSSTPARLGPIDINRPLPDYRVDTGRPYGVTERVEGGGQWFINMLNMNVTTWSENNPEYG